MNSENIKPVIKDLLSQIESHLRMNPFLYSMFKKSNYETCEKIKECILKCLIYMEIPMKEVNTLAPYQIMLFLQLWPGLIYPESLTPQLVNKIEEKISNILDHLVSIYL